MTDVARKWPPQESGSRARCRRTEGCRGDPSGRGGGGAVGPPPRTAYTGAAGEALDRSNRVLGLLDSLVRGVL